MIKNFQLCAVLLVHEKTFALLQNISPSLLLTAFLPILLFAAAFGLEWHYIRRLIGSSLLLAGKLHALRYGRPRHYEVQQIILQWLARKHC